MNLVTFLTLDRSEMVALSEAVIVAIRRAEPTGVGPVMYTVCTSGGIEYFTQDSSLETFFKVSAPVLGKQHKHLEGPELTPWGKRVHNAFSVLNKSEYACVMDTLDHLENAYLNENAPIVSMIREAKRILRFSHN